MPHCRIKCHSYLHGGLNYTLRAVAMILRYTGQIMTTKTKFYNCRRLSLYEGVTKSFPTGRLKRELQTVQLSATRCSCIAIL
jgi:hypothetical protein